MAIQKKKSYSDREYAAAKDAMKELLYIIAKNNPSTVAEVQHKIAMFIDIFDDHLTGKIDLNN